MNKKLSIVFVTNNYSPYQGGVVSSIVTTREALRAQGHIVHLITLDFTGNHHHEEGVIRLHCPVRFMYKKNHMALPLFAHTHLDQLLKQLKPDIVHIHHPFLLGQAALQAAQENQITSVFTYHTLYEHYVHYIPLIPKVITQHALHKRLEKFCNSIDGIIAPGSYVEKQIRAYAPKKPVQIIPSSIAPLFFENRPELPKSITKPFTLLTVSRFTPEKNIPFLLDVMKLLKNCPFRLILAGYGSEYDQLKAYAYKVQKLSPNTILFIEKPSKELLINLYHQAHLFLFASTSDTQGLVLAEAMSQGTPVIALDGPGQRDSIKNGHNGFLVTTQNEMAQKIRSTLSNRRLLTMLQNNTLETAQNYSSTRLTEKLTDFYRSLLVG